MTDQDSDRGVYAISVVAELLGTGQQNIRLYERRGLLTPGRTLGGTRQYSESDLAVLRRIGELLDEGLNLAGVAKVLELEVDNARLRRELERARSRARAATASCPLPLGSRRGPLPCRRLPAQLRPPARRKDSSSSSASSSPSSLESRTSTNCGDLSWCGVQK